MAYRYTDVDTRAVYSKATGEFDQAGKIARFWYNADGTGPVDIGLYNDATPTVVGASIGTNVLTVQDDSMWPAMWDRTGTQDHVYVQVGTNVTPGKLYKIYCDADQRSDSLDARVAELEVSVTDAPYKADPTGATSALSAFQAAAVAAKTAGRKLKIPGGSFRIDGRVDVATSLICEGEIVIDTNSAAASIRFVRTATQANLTPAALGGLTAGSTRITGIGGQRGALALTSSEHVIERNNGVGQFYTKTETVKVINDSGDIAPPLDNAYATGQLTAILSPEDPAVTVEGLRVCLTGTTLGANDHVVGVYRDDITLNDLQITNTTSLQPVSGVRVQSAYGVRFNRPRIHGFDQPGAGYGIAVYASTLVTVTDPVITRCRHSVSGTYMKRVAVRGGSTGVIDSHWGSGITAEGTLITVAAGETSIAMAGKDLTVRGCKFVGGRNVIGVRDDTPELAGTLELIDCDWEPSAAAAQWLVGYGSPSGSSFNFGRTVVSPSTVLIRDIRIKNPVVQPVTLLQLGSRDYPHAYWTNIDVDNVQFTANPGALLAYSDDKDSANHPDDTVGAVARFSRLDFTAVASDSIALANTGDITDGKGFDLTVTDCRGVYLKVPENGMSALSVRRSTVKRLFRVAASAQAFAGNIAFADCTMDAAAFNGTFLADFRDCVWAGTATSSNLTMDSRVKSYIGNLHVAGAAGYPAVPDGYTNDTYWIRRSREFEGTGSPEGVIVGNIGDRYHRLDGGPSFTEYIKSSNSGLNIGWRSAETEYQAAATLAGAAQSIAFGTAPSWVFTLTANQTFTSITGARVGGRLRVMIKQDATGGRTVTWPSTIKWASGTAPQLSTAPNAVDVFTFEYEPAGFWREASRSLPVGSTAGTIAAGDDARLAAAGILVSQQAGATSLAKIQAAVDAAATLGTWALVDGNYSINGTINVASGARIDMSRGSITQTGSLTAVLKLTNATGVRIQHPRLTGLGSDYVNNSGVYAAAGIWMTGTTSDVLISGGSITNMAGMGVRADNGVSNWRVRGVTITGPGAPPVIPSTSNYGACIGTFDGCNGWAVTDCELSQHAQGIVTGEVNDFRIANNWIHNVVGQHGMYLEPGGRFTIIGNVITATTLQGIKLQIPFSGSPDATDGVIVGNVITGCGSHGILVTNIPGGARRNRRIEIAHNVITGDGSGAGDGIQCNYLDEVQLSSNTAINVRKGYSLTTCVRFDMYDNRVNGATDQGYTLVDCSDGRISRGRIIDVATAKGASTQFGVQISGSASANLVIEGIKVTDSSGTNMRYALNVGNEVDQSTMAFRDLELLGATDYGARLNSAMTIGEWSNNVCTGALGDILGFPSTLVVKGAPAEYTGTAAPTSGTWPRGTVVWNRTPASGGVLGWVCTTAGTPGTWSSFGKAGTPWTTPGMNAQLGGTFDVLLANANAPAMTAGVLYLARLDLAFAGAITTVNYLVAVAGSTLTAGQNLIGIYQYAVGGALLSTSVDQTTNFGATGQKAATLGTPTAALDPGTSVYVGFLWNGTTSPQIRALATSAAFANVGVAALPRFATAGTGLTALPATLPTLAAATVPYWFGVS